jgi:nucleotidyltransferase substrate binding protein (TIGR01987 family)
MSDELSFDALEKAIAVLEEGLLEHAQYPQLLTVRDGVIQRFEVAVDVSQKLMKRVLLDVFSIDAARVQKNTAREAASMGLIADAEAWIGHINARNETSHTYDSAKANQVFQTIPGFLPDARDLLARLKNAVA